MWLLYGSSPFHPRLQISGAEWQKINAGRRSLGHITWDVESAYTLQLNGARSELVPACLHCFQALTSAGRLKVALNHFPTVSRPWDKRQLAFSAIDLAFRACFFTSTHLKSPPQSDVVLLALSLHAASFLFLQSPKCLEKKDNGQSLSTSVPGSSPIFTWIIDPDPLQAT